MTADQQPDVVVLPWRVKLKTRGSTWFSPGLTEAQAVARTAAMTARIREVGDGPTMVAFPTRYGVDAMVRARDVTSVEPVGPRWDGEDDVVRLADLGGPVAVASDADSGTAWLRTRERQRQGRPTGVRS